MFHLVLDAVFFYRCFVRPLTMLYVCTIGVLCFLVLYFCTKDVIMAFDVVP